MWKTDNNNLNKLVNMNQELPNDFDSKYLLIQTLQQSYKDFFGFVFVWFCFVFLFILQWWD